MATYSNERKAEVLQRLKDNEHLTVSQRAKEEGISKSTIQGWVKQAEEEKSFVVSNPSLKERTSEEKFCIVMESFSLNEAELSEYARKKGIFISEIQDWKKNCFSANNMKPGEVIQKGEKETLKNAEKKIKSLEKELNRKEKALAEAVALLVLSNDRRKYFSEKQRRSGGRRGRMISAQDRQYAVELINVAMESGVLTKTPVKFYKFL